MESGPFAFPEGAFAVGGLWGRLAFTQRSPAEIGIRKFLFGKVS